MKINNVKIAVEDGSINLVNVQSYGYDITDRENIQMFFNHIMIEGNPEGHYIIPLDRVEMVTVDNTSSLYAMIGNPKIKGGL